MPTAGAILLVYLLGGLLILVVFDLITKRIRSNLSSVGLQAQLRMAEANHPIGRKSGLVLMLVLTWLAWPVVLIGVLTDRPKEDQAPEIQGRTDVIGAGAGVRWSYLVKKIWYGECPDCHVILTPLDAWGQYSECPQCKTTFHGLRMKAKKEEHNGKTG